SRDWSSDVCSSDLLMKNYMIQNSIWWIEYSGLQGIRMDTYPYPDKHGMADWILRLKKEYPDFSVVGETWITQASKLVYWQKDFPNKDGYNSHLEYLMDFPMADALTRAFNEGEGRSEEHTSELQSRENLVCRLLLEK